MVIGHLNCLCDIVTATMTMVSYHTNSVAILTITKIIIITELKRNK